MSSITLTYWNGRGRAEPIRCLLALAGIDWEERYLSKREDLLELRKKGKLMYGQVPLLEIGGGKHCLVQSGAILRYVAESADLVPKNALERYYAQAIVDGVNDMRGCVISYPFHLDMERAKKEILSKVDRYFQTWESMLAEKEKKPDTAASSSKSAEDVSPFFFERCSVADAVVFEVLDFIECVAGSEWTSRELLKDLPRLAKLKAAVSKHGRLPQYLSRRAKTQLPWAAYADTVRKTLDGIRGQ